MGRSHGRVHREGVRYLRPSDLQNRTGGGVRLERDPNRVISAAEEIIEAARRALPGMRRRLVEAKAKSQKLLVIASRRKGRTTRGWKGKDTSDIPDLGSVVNILELESEIQSLETLIQLGVPSDG